MDQSSRFLDLFYTVQNRWATKRNIVILAIIYPIFPAFLLPWVGNVGGAPILDLHLFYDADTVREVLLQYSDSAIQNYIFCALTVDMVYPVYYASLLSLCIAFSLKNRHRSSGTVQRMRLLPFLIMLADWAENLMLVAILDQWPIIDITLTRAASFATLAKWLLLLATISFLSAMLFIRIKHTYSDKVESS